jgi:hypothetical protein
MGLTAIEHPPRLVRLERSARLAIAEISTPFSNSAPVISKLDDSNAFWASDPIAIKLRVIILKGRIRARG